MKLSSKIIQLIQLTISDNNKVEIDDKSILRSCPDFYTMNAYTFDIFIMHSIVMENTEEDGMYTTTCELLEIGPLNGPDINNLESIKAIIRDISSTPVIQEWWADFSTWEDFFGILRAGTELSMHSIVTKINNQLTLLENGVSYIQSYVISHQHLRFKSGGQIFRLGKTSLGFFEQAQNCQCIQ